MKRVIVTAASAMMCTAVASCGCASALERDSAMDTGTSDSGPETGPVDAADGGVCRPTSGFSCYLDADCVVWGSSVAPPGTQAVTICGRLPDYPAGICTIGITDCHTMGVYLRCSCGPGVGECTPGYICVTDTPGGPTRCAQQCEGH